MSQPFTGQAPAMEEKPHGFATQTVVNGAPTTAGAGRVFKTPTWVKVVRGFQILFGLFVMVLSGLLIHGKLMDELAFALVCGLFTWGICIYSLVTELVQGARRAYNVYAVLALDMLMVIFWLASMGAVASLRASFKYPVNIFGCYDDGSAIDSSTCIVGRDLEKRAAVANSSGLAAMSGIAGLSALELLLFVATSVWLFLEWRRSRSTGPTPSAVEMNTGVPITSTTLAPQAQQQAPPMYPVQPHFTGQYMPPQTQQQPQPFAPSPVSGHPGAQIQPQFTGQQQPSPHYGQQPMPYQQVPTPGPQGAYNELPSQQGHNYMYSPSASPAPQGQFQPPAQPYSPAPPQELPNQQQYSQYPPQQYSQQS